jgi:hypothetical protein
LGRVDNGRMGTDRDLRAELLERAANDQHVRALIKPAPGEHQAVLPDDVAQEWQRVDDDNAAWLYDLIADQGWPPASVVGEDGSAAAGLIAQHADHHPEWQRAFLDALAAAVDQGEATRRQLAYLEDRVRVNAGRPQLYGTQFTVVGGSFGPHPIEDPASLDQRRAAAGLQPFAEYERLMTEQ